MSVRTCCSRHRDPKVTHPETMHKKGTKTTHTSPVLNHVTHGVRQEETGAPDKHQCNDMCEGAKMVTHSVNRAAQTHMTWTTHTSHPHLDITHKGSPPVTQVARTGSA